MEKLGSLPENEEPFNVKNWRIGRQLGAGLCGHVHVGEKGKRKIAMKVIDLDELHRVYTQYEVSIEQLNKEVKKEVKVLGLLQHPNIVALVDSFRIGNVVYIGMELVDGPDLLSIIPPRGMNEAAARPLFAQICSAVAYCHSRMVIHGDLKPENILMTDNSRMIKLIDFGFSQIYQPGKKSAVIGGTVVYSPPLDREMTFAWDNWACGVILYGMLTHQLPFTQKELLSRTDLVLSVPETSSPELIDLVVSLFAIKARDRATVTQALKSPWVNHIQTSPYPARRQPSLSHPSPVPQVTTKERVNPIKRTRRLFPLLPRWKKDKNSDQRAAQSPTLSQSPDTSPAQSPTMKNQRKNKVNRQVESGDRLGDGPQYSEKGKASSVPSSPRSAILQAKTKRKNQRQLENGDYTVSESDFVTAQKGSCEIQNRSSKQKLPRSGMGSLRGDRRGSNKLKASLDDVWFSLFHPSNPTRDAPSRPEMRTDSSNSSPNSDSSTPCLSSSRSPDSHLNSVVSPIPSKRSKSKKQRSLKISDTSNEEDWESGSPTQEVPQQGIGRKEVEQRLAEAIHQDRTPKRLKDKDRLEMRSMDSNSPINRKKSYTFRNRLVQNATVRSGRTPQDTILPENLADQRKCRSILTPPALSQNFKKPGRRTTVSSFDRERDRDPHFVCTESLFIPSFGSSRSSGCPSPAMSLDNPSPAMSLDETPFSSLPTSPNSLRSPPPSPQNSPQNSPPGSPIQTSLFSPSFAPSFNFTNPSTPSSCSLSSSSTDSTSSSSSFILNSSSLASSCSCSCSTLPPSTSSKSSSSSCSSSSFSIPLPPLTVSRNSFSPLSPLSPVSPISPSASFSSSLTTPSSSFLSSPSPPSSPSSPLSVSPSFSTKVSSSPCQEQWYMDITEKLEHV